MKTYTVLITETLQAYVPVEAETKEEAFEKAKQLYRDSEIIFDDSNYTGADFEVLGKE